MRTNDIKFLIYLLSLGAALVAYGHSTFATKYHVEKINSKLDKDLDKIQRLVERVDDKLYKLLNK